MKIKIQRLKKFKIMTQKTEKYFKNTFVFSEKSNQKNEAIITK